MWAKIHRTQRDLAKSFDGNKRGDKNDFIYKVLRIVNNGGSFLSITTHKFAIYLTYGSIFYLFLVTLVDLSSRPSLLPNLLTPDSDLMDRFTS